ncbi:B12-binding domain-containing radical SAM protein [Candidatus Omnitrophota bacterium]
MKIALIHCPFQHRTFSENLKVVDEEFCLAPPIVLAYVAAILEQAGHKVIIVDANALRLTKEKVLKILQGFSPEAIGFRADTYWFHKVREWANYFKKALGVKIIVGGINVTLYPEESLSYTCFDYGIIGEANDSLPKLISAIENKDKVDGIKGVVYRNNGKVLSASVSSKLIDFNQYPFPARHLLPNHLYYSFTSQRKNYTVILTSTGCPFKCSFCAIWKLPYRERLPRNVVDEIEECVTRYNVAEVDFFDATFFVNKERALAICDEILRRGIKIEWSCRSRVDVVDEDILSKAAQAGCKKIYYGIESTSAEVLKNINKQITRSQITEAINLTHKYGIDTLGFFMIGNPGDTSQSILSSIKFAKQSKLDFIQVCRTIPKPNTELNNLLIETCNTDYWKKYILGQRDGQRLPRPWSDIAENEIEEYTRKFYRDFYFRPSAIFRRICKLKSFEEFIRYVKVSSRWLLSNPSDISKKKLSS